MQFASVTYMLFLAVAVAVHFALPSQRLRTLWLLAASYAFYYTLSAGWTVVLAAITAIGYVAGRLLERSGPGGAGSMSRPTKRLLTLSITLVVGVLAVFKYAGFAAEIANGLLDLAGSGTPFGIVRLALPVGISFWTFQSIAYLVDVARGTLPAERNAARYALSIAFFPHVTAGPIARGGQILPQFAERRAFSYEGMRSGLLLMLWGFFKKLLVADPLSVFVASVFAAPRAYADSGLVLAAAAVGFAIQIYADFSGYTDIARGTARLFGVELARNFDRPYASRSVKEFWRRWHMTLMGWLKDYLYIPLGGSRVPKARRYLNILVVFAVSGLWHGAGLTFIVWGLLNGAYQIAGEWLAPLRERAYAALRIAPDGRLRGTLATLTTFVLVTIGWVFFRAESLADALYVVTHMFAPTAAFLADLRAFDIGLSPAEVARTAIATVAFFGIDWLSARRDLPGWLYARPLALRWAIYELALVVVLVFGQYGPGLSTADFVYFKF